MDVSIAAATSEVVARSSSSVDSIRRAVSEEPVRRTAGRCSSAPTTGIPICAKSVNDLGHGRYEFEGLPDETIAVPSSRIIDDRALIHRMTDLVSGSKSAVSRLPPRTVGNLVLALLGLPLSVILLESTNTDLGTVPTLGIHWMFALAVLGIAIYGEDLSFADLGFRKPTVVDLGYLLITTVGILLVYTVTPPLIEGLGLPVGEGGGLVGTSAGIGVAIAYAVTIGTVEEILFRGYPIERLLAYTDSSLVAGGFTWVVFTAAHAVNWPLGSLLQTAAVAAMLTVVYLRRRTLAPVVGAHVFVWVFAALGQFYG